MEEDGTTEGGVARLSMEFVIPGECVGLLRQNASRVKKLFNVESKFSNTFQRGNTTMQWVNLVGGEMENAKTYILSMTSPDAMITVENFPPSLYQSCVDEVETETCAYLTQSGNSVVLQGSQLAAVLAQSMLESVQQESTSEKNPNQKDALGQDVTDGESTLVENTHVQDATSLKMPIDSPEWLVSASSSSTTSHENNSMRIPPSRSSGQFLQKVFPAHQQSSPSHYSSQTRTVETDSAVDELFFVDRKGLRDTNAAGSSPRSSYLVNFTDSKNDHSLNSPDDGTAMQYKYLRDLGLAHHYSVNTIEAALKRCDMTDVVRPNEFLNILNHISPKTESTSSSFSNSSTQSNSHSATSFVSDGQTANTTHHKKRPSPQPSVPKNDNVILINSDSENDSKGKLVDEMEAYVISSEEDQPFTKSQKRKKVKKSDAARRKPPVRSQDGSKTHPVLVSNLPAPQPVQRQNAVPPGALRHIVIDGSNVAMHHGEHRVYSVKGIQICIDYFLARGHKVTALVSGSRRYFQPRKTFPMKDKHLLDTLEKEGNLKFTPARRLVTGKIISSYDDRFVLNLAQAEGGIVVSNDQYRDLLYEKPDYQDLIENRLLPFMFVGDLFMPPDDPLGRDGPTLDQFLRLSGGGTSDLGAPAARGAGAVPQCQRQPFSTPGQEQQLHPPAKKRKVLAPCQSIRGETDQLRSQQTITDDTDSAPKEIKISPDEVPLRYLRELHPSAQYTLVKKSAQRQMYTMAVTVVGKTFNGTGSTKRKAKQAAARIALQHAIGGSEAAKNKTKITLTPKQDKTPVKHLRQLHPDIGFKPVKVSEPNLFTMGVSVIGMMFKGSGPTKKKAKQEAAKSALQHLMGKQTTEVHDQSGEENPILKLRESRKDIKWISFDKKGPSHASVHTTVLKVGKSKFEGVGPSKQLAKHAAARKALKMLYGIASS